LRSVNARHSLLPQTTLKDSTSAATRMNHAHLIVMGINEFKNHSPLTHAVADALLLESIFNASVEQSWTFTVNRLEPPINDTRSLHKAIEEIALSVTHLTIAIATHGARLDVGDGKVLHFALSNSEAHRQSSYLSISELIGGIRRVVWQQFRRVGRVVVLLDCCLTGAVEIDLGPNISTSVVSSTSSRESLARDFGWTMVRSWCAVAALCSRTEPYFSENDWSKFCRSVSQDRSPVDLLPDGPAARKAVEEARQRAVLTGDDHTLIHLHRLQGLQDTHSHTAPPCDTILLCDDRGS
jgi:hypothetical protein